MRSSEYDVVVVGAGPVGFTLAIDLGRRGVRTLLVEKDPDTKQWPRFDYHLPELRWVDASHMDERSAAIVAGT